MEDMVQNGPKEAEEVPCDIESSSRIRDEKPQDDEAANSIDSNPKKLSRWTRLKKTGVEAKVGWRLFVARKDNCMDKIPQGPILTW